jgi:large subunit ribosomal protein L10
MDRAGKAQSIETLKGVFADSGAVVVTHYLGLTVKELEDLRGRLRGEGATLKVIKNTLAQKAMDGMAGEAGDALFTGPVAIAYAPDPVSAAKVTTDYAKTNDKFIVWAPSWARPCWTPRVWARWPPCRRWTSSAARSWA